MRLGARQAPGQRSRCSGGPLLERPQLVRDDGTFGEGVRGQDHALKDREGALDRAEPTRMERQLHQDQGAVRAVEPAAGGCPRCGEPLFPSQHSRAADRDGA